MEKKRSGLSWNEKQEALFASWLSSQDVEFVSADAERQYKERVTRIKDAIQLKQAPDRVPVCPIVGFFPAYYAGITPYDALYDYEKLSEAWGKYVLDFQPDAHVGILIPTPGRIHDILDYKLYAWPGHGVSPNSAYQCLEKEYFRADEYDAFIQDPQYYFSTKYMPRVFGNLQGLAMIPNFTNLLEIPFVGPTMIPFGLPEVQEAYKALFEAGAEALRWIGHVTAYDKKMAAHGYPGFFGGISKAPFDVIGDTLRGTRGIMMDLHRQPDKVLKAMEVVTPFMVEMGVSAAKRSGCPIIFIPLHKGADGFLSDEQFKTFYWPSLRQVMLGLIEEGCVPFPWAEGGYNTRLEVIRDTPKGAILWGFDSTDMARAKEVLGDVSCIGGNVSLASLTLGSPAQVMGEVKRLVTVAGKGGGYVLINGAAMDDVKPENVHALIDAAKEFGRYS